MIYVYFASIGALLGVVGGAAFALASPETREFLLGLPLWAMVAMGLILGALVGSAGVLWHRRRQR